MNALKEWMDPEYVEDNTLAWAYCSYFSFFFYLFCVSMLASLWVIWIFAAKAFTLLCSITHQCVKAVFFMFPSREYLYHWVSIHPSIFCRCLSCNHVFFFQLSKGKVGIPTWIKRQFATGQHLKQSKNIQKNKNMLIIKDPGNNLDIHKFTCSYC